MSFGGDKAEGNCRLRKLFRARDRKATSLRVKRRGLGD